MAGEEGNLPQRLNPRDMLSSMSTGQFVALIIIALCTLLLIAVIILQANIEEKEPLFLQRVSAETEVQVRNELTSRQIAFEITDNGKILVPKSQVRNLRVEFEAMNMTPGSTDGMSILDNTNPLKAGEQMMKLKSIQALQVDVQNMLEQNPNVAKAMVQIVSAKDSPFADGTEIGRRARDAS